MLKIPSMLSLWQINGARIFCSVLQKTLLSCKRNVSHHFLNLFLAFMSEFFSSSSPSQAYSYLSKVIHFQVVDFATFYIQPHGVAPRFSRDFHGDPTFALSVCPATQTLYTSTNNECCFFPNVSFRMVDLRKYRQNLSNTV